MEEVDALRQVCEGNKVPCLVERSRSGCGGHLWIFFESAVEAALARRFGMALLQKGAETVKSEVAFDFMTGCSRRRTVLEMENWAI